MPHSSLRCAVCATLLLASAHTVAQASDETAPLGLRGAIGLGVLNGPTYEGSPNRRTVAGPEINLSYRTADLGTFELGQRGLAWQAWERDDFRLGLTLGWDAGRKTNAPTTFNPTPTDKRLSGMGDVRASTEVGVLVGYGPLSLHAHKALGNRGHQGIQLDMLAQWTVELSRQWGLTLGAGLTWADQKYMQSYFGVTPTQALTSGFATHTPRAGIRKVEVSLGSEYALSKAATLQATLGWAQLTGDARSSPLAARKGAPSVSVGITHAF